jgi:hypothetical protein
MSIRNTVIFISLVLIAGTGFDEESAILGAGREFALMKTANGKVSDACCSKLTFSA